MLLDETELSQPMPKRFPIGPLPEDHDELFTLWAWAKRSSKSGLATRIVEARIEHNEELIVRIVQRAADRRGIPYEEMRRRILENPRYGWAEEVSEGNDEGGEIPS